jgi:hypothetical protein
MVYIAWEARNLRPAAPRNVARWFTEVTRNACVEDGDERLYEAAVISLRNALSHGTWGDAQGLEYLLELGEREAQLWGRTGRRAMDKVYGSLRNFSLSLDSGQFKKVLTRVAQGGKEVAPALIRAVLIAEFGPVAEIALQGAQIGVSESSEKPSRAVVVYEPTPERSNQVPASYDV